MRTPEGYRKRLRRYEAEGHCHYLTFSCFHNQRFLSGKLAPPWLVEAIRDARASIHFDLWAWAFMPEHVHLLLRPNEGTTVGRILSAIKVPVARQASAWVKKEAPHFLPRMLDVQPDGRRILRFWQRGGGYDRNIWSAQEVHEKIAYIHKNPIRRGLVQNPADWPWSSYAAWTRGLDEPLALDRDTLPPAGGA